MSKGIDQLLEKYPGIVKNLQESNFQHDLVEGRESRNKTLRKRSNKSKTPPEMKQFRRKVLKSYQDHLFLCLQCKRILKEPVTLHCGHTFCKSCLGPSNFTKSCFLNCNNEDEENLNVNITINSFLSKWLNVKGFYQDDVSSMEDGTMCVDFECILCSQCLLDPVTTNCGHTFCRSCLARVFDHRLSCPLCMRKLTASDLNRKTTHVLVHALNCLMPNEHMRRMASLRNEINKLEENSQVPVFVCTNAFPNVACPLFVYEPRYRLLTRRCLQSTSKTFAMAVKANASNSDEKFASFGTILEVRDAVYMPDGTWILSTVGLKRFKVINRSEKDGYDTAEIEYIKDAPIAKTNLTNLISLHDRVRKKSITWLRSLSAAVFKEIERTQGPMPNLESGWIELPDGPSWTWWLIPIFPLGSHLQLSFLSSISLEKRLRATERLLDYLAKKKKECATVTTTIVTPTTSTPSTTTSSSSSNDELLLVSVTGTAINSTSVH